MLCRAVLLACVLLQVPGFRASKFKVTNGEFAAFVRSQGYTTRKWWSEEGWGWRTFRNVKWPTFWVLGEFVKLGLGSSRDWGAAGTGEQQQTGADSGCLLTQQTALAHLPPAGRTATRGTHISMCVCHMSSCLCCRRPQRAAQVQAAAAV